MTAADLFEGTAGHLVAGVDEVGRGPLAGDVVAAAVILAESPPKGVTDSKMLTSERREALAERIRDEAVSWALGRATVAEIDNLVGCIHRCRPLMDNINAAIRGETIIVMAYGAVVSEAAKIQVGEEAGVVALRRLN